MRKNHKKPPADNPTKSGSTAARRFPVGRRGQEGRKHPRTLCSEETHFSANRRLFEGVIKNTSPGGTYIQVKGNFIVGQDIVVAGTFEAGGIEEKRFGKVVRLDGSGIGVEFIRRDAYLRR